jgi:RNA polymerase sigma-70 factor (ECF subfamily)
MLAEHVAFTRRCLRGMGLPPDVADDATQQVFLTASSKIGSIEPGRERAFLFQTAVRVARSEKRAFARRRRLLVAADGAEALDASPSAEEQVDRYRAREFLDGLLASMCIDVRAVFVLFELEGRTTAEIARLLGIPMGTAASRLRRARKAFEAAVRRYHALCNVERRGCRSGGCGPDESVIKSRGKRQ